MTRLLGITLAQKMSSTNGQSPYTPIEIEQKNYYMDTEVIRRVKSIMKGYEDRFGKLHENEQPGVALYMAYNELKGGLFVNQDFKAHINSFKSVDSFIAYYKPKLDSFPFDRNS